MGKRAISAWLSTIGAMTVIGLWSQSSAHHSFAMFDNTKEVEPEGTAKDFQWTHPHIWIQVLINESGKEVEYAIEGAIPNGLARNAWTRSVPGRGDKVKIAIHLLQDGGLGGSFVKLTFPHGRVLTQRGL